MRFFKHLLTPALVSFGLLTALLVALSGCQPVAADKPPHLLATIDLAALGQYIPTTLAVNRQGLAYVFVLLSEPLSVDRDSIVVLDGPQVQTILHWPDQGGVVFPKVAAHPFNNWLYVTDSPKAQIRIISGTQVLPPIQNINGPLQIAAHPNNGYVYVAQAVYDQSAVESGNIDTAIGAVAVLSGTEIITQIITQAPRMLGIDQVHGYTYVGQETMDYTQPEPALVLIKDTTVITKLTPHVQLEGGSRIDDLAVNERTGEVYYFDRGKLIYWDGHDRVTRLDMGFTQHIVIDAQRGLAYVSRDAKPNIVVLRQDEVVAELFTSHDAREMAVDPRRDYVYVANREGTLSVLRGSEVITTLVTGGIGASYLSIDVRRGYIYVVNSDSNSVAVFGFEDEADPPSLWQLFLPWLNR